MASTIDEIRGEYTDLIERLHGEAPVRLSVLQHLLAGVRRADAALPRLDERHLLRVRRVHTEIIAPVARGSPRHRVYDLQGTLQAAAAIAGAPRLDAYSPRSYFATAPTRTPTAFECSSGSCSAAARFKSS